MLAQQVRLARDAGALDQLPIVLSALGTAAAWSGDFTAAAALISEADAVCEATGSRTAPFAAILLAALRGEEAEAAPLIEATISSAAAGGQGMAVAFAHWVAAILANGLGHYGEALAAAQQAAGDPFALYISMWALPELIEAAVRSGNPEVAGDALDRLTDTTGRRDRFGAGHAGAVARTAQRGRPAPRACTAKRSTGSAAPSCGRSWRALTCSTASGCAGRTGGRTPGPSCAPRTICWARWA